MVAHLHSVPAGEARFCAETVSRRPHPGLRPYVAGYAGFRAADGRYARRRVLSMNLTTLIIDATGVPATFSGPSTC